ncbi:hypothetical protein FIBSPDRAFT_178216 [Athelia psychrophila]|uniref:Uncharacterized protein n=1 Tax=Athelia psychrophila TaxID=1759441 RepID=A0A166SQ60_9AGAM|nr:hypothetical protein FIBSPDRAFT_178216 [Fibularhizoctonia sp. CBS 109695]
MCRAEERKGGRVENVRMRTVLGFKVEARVTVRGRVDMEIEIDGGGDGDRGGGVRGGSVILIRRGSAWYNKNGVMRRRRGASVSVRRTPEKDEIDR